MSDVTKLWPAVTLPSHGKGLLWCFFKSVQTLAAVKFVCTTCGGPGVSKDTSVNGWDCNTGGGPRGPTHNTVGPEAEICLSGSKADGFIKQRSEHSERHREYPTEGWYAHLFVIPALKNDFPNPRKLLRGILDRKSAQNKNHTETLGQKTPQRQIIFLEPGVIHHVPAMYWAGLGQGHRGAATVCKTSNATVIPSAVSILCKHCKMPEAFTARHKHESQEDTLPFISTTAS